MFTKPSDDKNTKSSLPRAKTALSKTGLIIFIVLFAAVGGYVLLKSNAAPAPPTIYLTPATKTNGPSSTFTVQVRENSATSTVNAVQANLSYPTSLLNYVSVDYTGSAFGTQAQSTGGSGVINIARGAITAVSGDQLIGTITFSTNTTGGAANVAFTTGTALVSSTTNLNLLASLAATGGGTYTTDVTPPTVSVSAPANNAALASGSTVAITAAASDSASAVASVAILIDGVQATSLTASPYTYNWNTAGLALGSHTIQARAADTFNNTATSATITVNLTDQTAPAAPTNLHSTATSLNSITLAWNASTDNVGVVNYQVKRNGTLVTTLNALTYADSGLTPGTSYNYSILALDAAGNISTAATLSVSTVALTPGDVNGDGHVDVTDLSVLLSNYGTTNAVADVNKDGVVDVFDLSILLSHYGT